MGSCKGPSIGAMRNIATIRQRVLADDGYGGVLETWESYLSIRCSVREQSGSEAFKRDDINTEEKLVFTTRYDSRIFADNGTLRIFFRDKIFNITWVNNIDLKDQWMEITGTLERWRTEDAGVGVVNLLLEDDGDLLLEGSGALLLEDAF